MRTAAALAAVLLLGFGTQDPVLHKDKVVLRTGKGDIVLALYPQVAPRHVKHFLALVRRGFYKGTRFALIRPGFIIQHAGEVERNAGLTDEQRRLANERIPAEFGPLRHVRGALSMSRQPDDIDSAQTSFVILLGDAPQLDGKYTIFGRVEEGWQALDALAATPTGRDFVPREVVNLREAFVKGEEPGPPEDRRPPGALMAVGGGAIALGLAAFLLAGRALPRAAGPIGLSLVISGFFVGFVAAVPWVIAEESRWPALILFVSMLALFKLMNRFESPKS